MVETLLCLGGSRKAHQRPCPSRWSASAPSQSCRTSRASALVVPGELEVEGLARHADRDVSDAGPGVEPRAQRPEGAVVRWHRARRESDCCPEELAALVEHELFNDLVGLQQQ
jgi:hypothetical protein